MKNKFSSTLPQIVNVIVVIVALVLGRAFPIPVGIIAAIYFSIVLGITINKYNAAKVSGGETKALKKEIQSNVAWVVFIAVVLGFQVWVMGGFEPKNVGSSYQTPTELASQGVKDFKSSTTLPYEVDGVTTLTDVTSDGSVIQYHYTIHDGDTSKLTDAALRESVQPNVCVNTSTKYLLEKGTSLQYTYVVKETAQQFGFTIIKSDC